MSFYSCTHAGDLYRITKLSQDLEVESSYLVSSSECQCPGFERRGSCRHHPILQSFIRSSRVGGEWLFNFDRKAWLSNPLAPEGSELTIPAPPPGVSMIVLDSPDKVVDVHNALADVFGEPKLETSPQPKGWRRL